MLVEIRWRDEGHQISPSTTVDILRFDVADLNMVIKSCVTAAEFYDGLVERGGLAAGTQVVPVSCFAVTQEWSPQRLAEDTRHKSYRLVEARVLLEAGFAIWPTDVFLDGVPDPRNEVHHDVIVSVGTLNLAEFVSTERSIRAAARARIRPDFERLMDLLGDLRPL